MEIKVTTNININDDDIEDILESAFIDRVMWSGYCEKDIPDGEKWLDDYYSKHIVKGGKLLMLDIEDGEEYILDRETILRGIGKAYQENGGTFHEWNISFVWVENNKIVNMDSWLADTIIQYGVFGEVIYG